jgi:alkylated DNA repair dioxygenase AlkB
MNLLLCDGEVHYYGKIFAVKEADFYFRELLRSIEWKQDEVVMFGKRIITARKVAWYGNAGFAYTYSGSTKYALKWNSILLNLKNKVEQTAAASFNSCLLNLYHNGEEGMSWHRLTQFWSRKEIFTQT